VTEISERYTVEGVYQPSVPVVMVHDPTQPDLSSHEFASIVPTASLVPMLGRSLRSLPTHRDNPNVVGLYAALCNSLPYNHVPDYVVDGEIALDKNIDHDLMLEGMAREIIRSIQNSRKKAGLSMEDEIVLAWVVLGDYLSQVQVRYLTLM
jgi:hypothetical protein